MDNNRKANKYKLNSSGLTILVFINSSLPQIKYDTTEIKLFKKCKIIGIKIEFDR